ncbi:YiiX/YebB-like N1pC/P60 family cysteine hydrolase [Proteus mirabilis]|uniref:YiiX/YebB-like N1pC/P60 family cysteine hydrolase n=1 Tax=Proteus mirabilis TaxID=584 RepID=UPI003F44125C
MLALPYQLKSGDLVFRDGDEVISDIIKQVDNSGFSHVGMLWITEQGIQVVHSTPSEHADSKDGVTIDSLDFFISRAKPNSVRFYQVRGSEQARQQALEAVLNRVGENFSIQQDKGVYCTELVADAWLKAEFLFQRAHVHYICRLFLKEHLFFLIILSIPKMLF